MENFAYHNPTRLYFGRQAIDELPGELEKYGQTILLVTGGGSVKRMGLYDTVMKLLHRGGKTVIELPGISSNPKYTHVLEGQRLCREHHVDLILAVGGGSCIDAAKGIAAATMMDGDVWEYFLSRASVERALPVATILTIPATGSEMNGNAVISRWDTKEKVAVYGNALYPAFSILDPVYSFSVAPRRLQVCPSYLRSQYSVRFLVGGMKYSQQCTHRVMRWVSCAKYSDRIVR